MANNPNVPMLEIVAAGLGPMKDSVVFVGGSIVAFYLAHLSGPYKSQRVVRIKRMLTAVYGEETR